MACITLHLFAQPMAMPTTQLVRAICYPDAFPWPTENKPECAALRMNWVVVTDSNGQRRLRMCWAARNGR